MSKDLDAPPPIRRASQETSRRKSPQKPGIPSDSSERCRGTKVESRLQVAQVRLVSRPFNPNTLTLYKELAMIKEFEKKQPVPAVTESGND